MEDSIDEKPVGGDVAFTESRPVVVQRVVLVLRRQGFAPRKLADDVIQERNVKIAFHGAFVVALEHVRPLDIEREFAAHRFNSARASAKGKPRRLGLRPISSVSRKAASVSGL